MHQPDAWFGFGFEFEAVGEHRPTSLPAVMSYTYSTVLLRTMPTPPSAKPTVALALAVAVAGLAPPDATTEPRRVGCGRSSAATTAKGKSPNMLTPVRRVNPSLRAANSAGIDAAAGGGASFPRATRGPQYSAPANSPCSGAASSPSPLSSSAAPAASSLTLPSPDCCGYAAAHAARVRS